MKFIASIFSRLYRYATVFVIVGSPLFFIPGTGFTPEATYYIVMSVAVAVALISYVVSALITKSWHVVSRLEFLSYFAFTIAVVCSVIFARNPQQALFGDALNPMSGVSLLALPVVVYLVRSLPASLRRRLKYIFAGVLAFSAFILMLSLIVSGAAETAGKVIFSGFSVASSFAAYIGIFVIACFFFAKKAVLPKKYKTAIIFAGIVFLSWVVTISAGDAARPDFMSSVAVGKNALSHDGIFGIGAGDYSRAWQLYRPAIVIASPYFGYDFAQGFSTNTTLLTTIGVIGLLAFLLLTLSGLYSAYISYKKSNTHEEHFISGMLTVVLLYFALISWVLPLSYALLVVWMVISGFGFAKAELTEYHPSKKLALIMIPLALVLGINVYMTLKKAQAFMLFTQAQNLLNTSGPVDEVGAKMSRAAALYPFDGFYRSQVEYGIAAEKVLLTNTTQSQDVLKGTYLQKAQMAVDAGLAAVRTNPSNYQNYVSLGRAYELAVPFDKEGGYDRAKKSYQKAVELYPENPYLYVMLARLEASAGTKAGVRSELTEALKKKENFADALYLMSQLEASENKADEALSYAVEAVKNAPNDPLVYTQAGLLYYGKKDYQNAVTSLKTALEKDPSNANIAYFLALALRDGGRPDIAKTIGDELLKRNPGNVDLEAFLKSLNATSTSTAKTSTPAKK
jgi:tetratricopeptide (TPR) repeat protein